MREEDHLADGRHAGEEHDQPVDPDPLSRRRRQAVLERVHVVLVHGVRLLVAGGSGRELVLEPLGLIFRIVQLREGVRDLVPRDVELEAVDEPRVGVVPPRERESSTGSASRTWLDEVRLDEPLEHEAEELAGHHALRSMPPVRSASWRMTSGSSSRAAATPVFSATRSAIERRGQGA